MDFDKEDEENHVHTEQLMKEKTVWSGDIDDFGIDRSQESVELSEKGELTSLKTPTKYRKSNVPASPVLSFLSSLSEITAEKLSHPEALVFKREFKNKKVVLTNKLFNLYNKEVFGSQLPADLLIEWNTRLTCTSGLCYFRHIYSDNKKLRSARIVLSTKILDRAERLRDTLIHELCHAATWIISGTSKGHGQIWRSWAGRANDKFPELPLITRCHDYTISTKFTYKCMSCGYCIGRQTKSLNTDRKRCGYCLGKFQVFVTAKMSAANATSVTDTEDPMHPHQLRSVCKRELCSC